MNHIDKIAFDSRGEAYDFVRTLRKYGNSTIYECRACGKWHISHFRQGGYVMKLQTLNKQNTSKIQQTIHYANDTLI